MDEMSIQEQETYTINNKNYNVIVKYTKQKVSREKLIDLIIEYGREVLEDMEV